MRFKYRRATLFLVLAVFALSAPQAAAKKVKKVRWKLDGPPPVIIVHQEDGDYKRAEPQEVHFKVKTEEECGSLYTPRDASMAWGKHITAGGYLEASTGYSQTFRRDGARWLTKTDFKVPVDKIGAVYRCRSAAHSSSEGPHKYKLRRHEHHIKSQVSYLVRCARKKRKKDDGVRWWGSYSGGMAYVVRCEPRGPVYVHPRDEQRSSGSRSGKAPQVRTKTRTSGSRSGKPASDTPQRTSSKPQRTKPEPVRTSPRSRRRVLRTKGLPDLIIREVRRVPDDDRNLRVRVANVGKASAGPTNLKLFYHRSGRVMKKGTFVKSLGAGEARWIVVEIGSPMSAAQSVSLRIDDPNRIKEADEGNNSKKVK